MIKSEIQAAHNHDIRWIIKKQWYERLVGLRVVAVIMLGVMPVSVSDTDSTVNENFISKA